MPAEKILNEGLIAGMQVVGDKFKRNEFYVPEVLIAARAMKGAMELLRPVLAKTGAAMKGTVVIGTVRGDLHDIGKIGISDTILHKPGRLEPAEWKLIRKHPIIGRQICESLPSPGELLDVIESHHEHLDGSGYPNGKSGDDISLYTRIISVSDVYDALTTDRPYRKRYTPSEAIQILEEETRKGWWDKDVLELLRVVIQ